MSCYILGDGTFDLKIHAVVVWEGGNLYNLDEMKSEMIFYKTMEKIFFQLIQYLRIVAISVEVPIYTRRLTPNFPTLTDNRMD